MAKKAKSHRGAAKRFRKTGTWQDQTQPRLCKSHILTKKKSEPEAQAAQIGHSCLKSGRIRSSRRSCLRFEFGRSSTMPRVKTRLEPPRPAPQGAQAREGVSRHQEQAVPFREGVRRPRPVLRLSRPSRASKREFRRLVDRPDWGRGPRGGHVLQHVHRRPDESRTSV